MSCFFKFILLIFIIFSPIFFLIRIVSGKEDPKRFIEKLCLYSKNKNINKTTIVIAHRLSTIQSASKIFVIDNGSVVSTGTHNELLNSSDIYTNFYNKQIKSN